jgi:hypothetical protein
MEADVSWLGTLGLTRLPVPNPCRGKHASGVPSPCAEPGVDWPTCLALRTRADGCRHWASTHTLNDPVKIIIPTYAVPLSFLRDYTWSSKLVWSLSRKASADFGCGHWKGFPHGMFVVRFCRSKSSRIPERHVHHPSRSRGEHSRPEGVVVPQAHRAINKTPEQRVWCRCLAARLNFIISTTLPHAM